MFDSHNLNCLFLFRLQFMFNSCIHVQNGFTALHIAAQHSSDAIELVSYLLSIGAHDCLDNVCFFTRICIDVQNNRTAAYLLRIREDPTMLYLAVNTPYVDLPPFVPNSA